MELTPVEKSIRALRFQENRRRLIAVICVVWGASMIGLNVWVRHCSYDSMSKLIENFYDSPMIAMPMMSAITVTIANSRFNMVIGIVVVAFGLVRMFVPDFKTVVLLEIARQLELGIPQEKEDDDST